MTQLGRRIVVVAFDGWNDAGEGASTAVRHLTETRHLEKAFTVDPELYFDFQYTRPTLSLDGGADGSRTLRWPHASLHAPARATSAGRPLVWTISGSEPARAWKAFACEFIDALLSHDITGMVTLGSMMGDVPHTRPIAVGTSSENARVREAYELERSTYEGPVGILSALILAAEQAGIPTLSLWASVPHYVAGAMPSPKAALALLTRLEELTGVEVESGTLATDALTWEASIDAAASDDDEMSDYIRQLEHARDTWDSPEASGESLAKEFERYLRRGDGREGRERR